jgi:hypothetical protein
LVTRGAIVLGATLLLGASATHAADQLILGKKLLIKNPPAGTASNKVVHLGKDPAITIGAAGSAGDPQCTGAGGGGTSSLHILASGGSGNVTIPLPCTGWTTNGTNSLYKYKDTTKTTCTIVLVKSGVLAKAICKGTQVAIDLNGSMAPVAVVTRLNTQEYCTEFGGLDVVKDGSDDKTFLHKNAPAPATCAPAEICDNAIDDDLDGFVDCNDPDCAADPLCAPAEDCSNAIDDDLDGFTDCNDPDCAADPLCAPAEDCSNAIDDDLDGFTDCNDPDCAADPFCVP